MPPEPLWKMEWTYKEIIQLLDFLIKKSATAERESHMHEMWTDALTFISKAFKKDYARISCVPQLELGYQTPADDADIDGMAGALTRSAVAELPEVPGHLKYAEFVFHLERNPKSLSDLDTSMTESVDTAINTAGEVSFATTTASDIQRDRERNKIPATTWRRPDWAIIGRRFAKQREPGKLAIIEEKEIPILLVEIKFPSDMIYLHDMLELSSEERDLNFVSKAVENAIPQVLVQAQYIFREYPDAGDFVHAIIGVGSFCQDFSISNIRLPKLGRNGEGRLFNKERELTLERRKELLDYAEKKCDPYHLLNDAKTGFHKEFKRAWSEARKVNHAFRTYQPLN